MRDRQCVCTMYVYTMYMRVLPYEHVQHACRLHCIAASTVTMAPSPIESGRQDITNQQQSGYPSSLYTRKPLSNDALFVFFSLRPSRCHRKANWAHQIESAPAEGTNSKIRT